MARLPNDCFANADEMISVDQARLLIQKAVTPVVGIETAPLAEARSRILGQDITALFNVPPAGNSAVDGYAFSFDDCEKSGRKMKAVGRSAAGVPFEGDLKNGECLKIFTGAVLPERCDTVAMIEDIEEEGDYILLPQGLRKGANFRQAGEDIKAGQRLLKSGIKLRPQELGQLASVGLQEIPVRRKLKIGLFSTGDELIDPGNETRPGGIFDSNRYMLKALLETYGGDVQDFGILADKLETVRDALKEASTTCDLVLTSGGVSMGDEDHVKAAVEEIGTLHFWRIAIKPGRPLAMGQVDGTAFVGLPGNPVAALVCALQFVRPLIAGLSGQSDYQPPQPIFGNSGFDMKKKPGRREWLRGRYTLTRDGKPFIEKYRTEGSGVISSLTWANGLIELHEDDTDINQGNILRFLPFTELFE